MTVSDGVSYEVVGSGSAQALFLHGISGNRHGLRQVAEIVANENDMTVILPELPGHGFSEELKNEHTIGAYSGWVLSNLGTFGIDKEFMLVGHSMGGTIATDFMGRHPERVSRAVLIGPAALSGKAEDRERQAKAAARMNWFMTQRAPESVYNLMYNGNGRTSPASLVARYIMGLDKEVADGVLKVPLRVGRESLRNTVHYDFLEGIVPYLETGKQLTIVRGENDLWQPRETLKEFRRLEKYSGFSTHVEPHADHHLPTRNPRRVVELIIAITGN